MTTSDLFDPKGLMREAFVIEGITAFECRSIFLDWVLGVPVDRDVRREVDLLVAHYAPLMGAAHPMLITLEAARETSGVARRRGGRQSRLKERGDGS